MLGPSISSERSTVERQDYESGAGSTNTAVYPGSLATDDSSFHAHHHSNSYASTAAQAAAELQHRAELQRRQQQLQQQELHQQQQLQQYHQAHHQAQQAQQQQQHHHQQMQIHLQQQQAQMQPSARGAVMLPSPQHEHLDAEYDNTTGGLLTSKYIENEIIKTFPSKQYLVKYVKDVLSMEERCKIVINSSKPKAVYFQCERSGSFRTTVKDATKRQRVAYTKRNKCGFRLVANLYPSEKDKKRIKRDVDDKSPELMLGEMWILRMIEPIHNHPPEPFSAKKRKLKSRTLVEKPIHRTLTNSSPQSASTGEAVAAAAAAAASHYVPNDMVHLAHQQMQHPLHTQLQHQHMHLHDEGQSEVIGMEAPAAVDPNIDPNVDPTVGHDGYRQLMRK